MFWPMELQTGPRPLFFFDSIVKAQPSTAKPVELESGELLTDVVNQSS